MNQRTLLLLKPDLFKRELVKNQVIKTLKAKEFKILRSRKIIGPQFHFQIKQFYLQYETKFFYNRLISSLIHQEFEAIVLEKENAIQDLRNLLGPTKPIVGRMDGDDGLRALYGISDTRNSFHASDSKKSAIKEIKLFFPDL